ncbi:uncharacterized protein STEHIDRAFT_162965 [Stereum hirsutum FP-91666 SS1]|uniref:VHS domain-containing protein n=1 Tax=Stereum hirsutum (strain FP-91666) TaxID=721885 RepID=R7RYV5_STEHR|nr:uncharacterized protein STEHIDRAFT_162965 [Stereum hirsutum FP-91666 SS1]EIM80080.1 hypothetical protein STEHIDRAFT_162965 [Stereum hirsutum FP-91666 SS1]
MENLIGADGSHVSGTASSGGERFSPVEPSPSSSRTMKKLFGRDKPKPTRVVPANRDSAASEVEVDDLSPPLFAQKSDSEVSLHDLDASPTPTHSRPSPPLLSHSRPQPHSSPQLQQQQSQHTVRSTHGHPHSTHSHSHHSQPQHPPTHKDGHIRTHSEDEDAAWHVVDGTNLTASDPALDPPRALPASRSSSLASLPPGASAPVPSPLAPRPSSPFAVPASIRTATPKEQQHFARDRGDSQASLAQLPPQPQRRPPAALNMIKSLDPQFDPARDREREREAWRGTDDSLNTQSDGSREEKDRREKKGLWDWATQGMERERDKRLHREKEKEKEEEEHHEITRMIGAFIALFSSSQPSSFPSPGYLSATASENWSIVLEVCERASATEANAKEAAKALKREFKYGEAPQQLSAARLWAIMLRNCSDTFIHQCLGRKFLDTIEDVLQSSKTSPVVRERIVDVLGAAAFASQPSRDQGVRMIWRKYKPSGKPDEGVPFEPDDAMFNPPEPKRSSTYGIPPGWVSVQAPSPTPTQQLSVTSHRPVSPCNPFSVSVFLFADEPLFIIPFSGVDSSAFAT